MLFYSIPPLRIVFSSDGDACYEQISLLADQSDTATPFFTAEELHALASGQRRPIASMLHKVIGKIEIDTDDFFRAGSDTQEYRMMCKNLNALHWFLSSIDTDSHHFITNFSYFRDQISQDYPFTSFPASVPYDTESGTELPMSEDFLPKVSTENGQTIYCPSAELDTSFHKVSKSAPVKKPYTELARSYIVSDLWEFCLATCEYIAQPYTPEVRLRKCVHCGRYYHVDKAMKNRRTCSDKCSQSHRKGYKQMFTEPQKLVKRILNMLGHRYDDASIQARSDFQASNNYHKVQVKKKRESMEEYTAWLEEMYDAYRINKPRKK